MTYQIIYSSEATTPMQTGELEEMLEHARRDNAAEGITGALIYAEGIFLQILEGDRGPVQTLMDKIRRDVRHRNVVVLREGVVTVAKFHSWKMAYVSATPQQVAKWVGLAVPPETIDISGEMAEDQQRTVRFAQDILSLLAGDKTLQSKPD